jgi:hypothetical protein
MLSTINIILILFFVILSLTLIYIEFFQFYFRDIVYVTQSVGHKMTNFLLNQNLLDKPHNKVNKIAFVTFENRKELEYINLHNQNLTEYCKKWNYDYLFYDQCTFNVYWCKMHFVLDALKTGKYDYVVWLDSDTIIKNPYISMDLIVNKYSSDIFVTLDDGISAFCAGVFIIKNSPIGISFIEECINLKSENCVVEHKNVLNGFYGGLCYEQGVMNKLIYNKYYKYTTCLPNYYVSTTKITESYDTCDTDTFILHLGMSENNLRSKCFKKFV